MGKAKLEAVRLAQDFKEKARKKYGIQRVILFGSQAIGSAKTGSDIDLLIVSDKFRNRAKFMSQLYSEWHISQKKRLPVDFLCFTKKEFRRMSKQITIVKQALEEGMEI